MKNYEKLLGFCAAFLVLFSIYSGESSSAQAGELDFNDRCFERCKSRCLQATPAFISAVTSLVDLGASGYALCHWDDTDKSGKNNGLTVSVFAATGTLLARSIIPFSYAALAYDTTPFTIDTLRSFAKKQFGVLSLSSLFLGVASADLLLSVIGCTLGYEYGLEIGAAALTAASFLCSGFAVWDLCTKKRRRDPPNRRWYQQIL